MEHDWELATGEAKKLQESLRSHLVQKHLPETIGLVAGADVSFNKFEKDVYAGIVVLSYPDLEPVEYSCVKMEVNFPYIPGYLSFREVPALLKAWENIKLRPDVVVVDGHGIAHPRNLGIAAHFGLIINVPTIGAAKKPLYGRYEEPSPQAGSFSYVYGIHHNDAIGTVLRTKEKVAPMFVSPGHLCTVDDANRLVLNTTRNYRLPEPTRIAHNTVNRCRTGELQEQHSYL